MASKSFPTSKLPIVLSRPKAVTRKEVTLYIQRTIMAGIRLIRETPQYLIYDTKSKNSLLLCKYIEIEKDI